MYKMSTVNVPQKSALRIFLLLNQVAPVFILPPRVNSSTGTALPLFSLGTPLPPPAALASALASESEGGKSAHPADIRASLAHVERVFARRRRSGAAAEKPRSSSRERPRGEHTPKGSRRKKKKNTAAQTRSAPGEAPPEETQQLVHSGDLARWFQQREAQESAKERREAAELQQREAGHSRTHAADRTEVTRALLETALGTPFAARKTAPAHALTAAVGGAGGRPTGAGGEDAGAGSEEAGRERGSPPELPVRSHGVRGLGLCRCDALASRLWPGREAAGVRKAQVSQIGVKLAS